MRENVEALQMKERVEILLQERKLLHQEKLQLVRTIKQTLTFLGAIIGLLGTGFNFGYIQVFLVIPPLIAGIGYYLLTNFTVFLWIATLMQHIDKLISKIGKYPYPFFHVVIGKRATWGWNITKEQGFTTLNPYYLVGIHIALPVVGVYIFSVVRSCTYLSELDSQWANALSWAFLFIGIVMLGVLGLMALQYFRHFREISTYWLKRFREELEESN